MFAIATVLEGSIFLNGGPQNTLVPGLVDLACKHSTFVGGSDFKTGQTKLKAVLADFWTSAGFRLRSVVSYNHLGNNDGRNLSEREQFLSKEQSKSMLLEQIISTNEILFPPGSKKPDHEIVIKYAPSTGDHKRAIDEYVADICMEEQQSLVVYNVCPDSLLCVALILDLAIFADWLARVRVRQLPNSDWKNLTTTMPLLSYFFKVTQPEASASLFEQRLALIQMILACSKRAGGPFMSSL
jgi:myo-inositol-1-phosphate synthase